MQEEELILLTPEGCKRPGPAEERLSLHLLMYGVLRRAAGQLHGAKHTTGFPLKNWLDGGRRVW